MKIKKTFVVILSVVMAVTLLIGTTLSVSAAEEVTLNETDSSSDAVTNVVFLGIDWQENRSDVMMVLSINKETNSIKLISLLRDTEVMIDGCSCGTKLGFAYKWGCMDNGITGGSEKALDVINANFGTDYEYYVDMWFDDVADIIDIVGGVDINLFSQEETDMMNGLAKGMGYTGDDIVYDASKQPTHLAGWQAVAYSRIRYVNITEIGGDYDRAHRQQAVVKQLFEKLKSINDLDTYKKLIQETLLGDMVTNLSLAQLFSFAEMDMSTLTLECENCPDDNFLGQRWSWESYPDISENRIWGGWVTTPSDYTCKYMDLDPQVWMWVYNLDIAGEALRKATSQQQKTVKMHRLYNPNTGEHLYTSLNAEVDFLTPLGWQYEGVAWDAPETSEKPVYRLYNPNSGDHHYTMSEAERDWLVGFGWQYEDIAWYSGGDVPVYRLFNPNATMATHHYTAFTKERDWLFTLGWQNEDVAWYALSIPE